MIATPSRSPALPSSRHLVRLVLASFLFTFIAARILTFLIMSRRIPDLYLRGNATRRPWRTLPTLRTAGVYLRTIPHPSWYTTWMS
jgi:hypothetical protein